MQLKKCKDMQIYRFKIFYISVFVISDQNSAMKRAGEQVLKSAFRNSVPEEILACFYRSVDVEAFCTSCEAFECWSQLFCPLRLSKNSSKAFLELPVSLPVALAHEFSHRGSWVSFFLRDSTDLTYNHKNYNFTYYIIINK